VRKKTLVFVAVVLVLISSQGCGEDQHNQYATTGNLRQAGAGARSWFPPSLPDAAFRLEEWHNLDTNIVVGRFELPCSDIGIYARSLRGSSVRDVELVSDADDWPECLRGRINESRIRSCGMQTYVDGKMTLAIDTRGCVVYFWN